MADMGEKRGRQKYKNLNISRTKTAFKIKQKALINNSFSNKAELQLKLYLSVITG